MKKKKKKKRNRQCDAIQFSVTRQRLKNHLNLARLNSQESQLGFMF